MKKKTPKKTLKPHEQAAMFADGYDVDATGFMPKLLLFDGFHSGYHAALRDIKSKKK